MLEELRGHDAILLGAIGDPTVPSGVLERGVLLRLRFAIEQYVNLRPARLFPGVDSPLAVAGPGIDFVVVREGTEGPYTGNGGGLRVGHPARGGHRGQRQHRLRRRAGRPGRLRARPGQAAPPLTLVHKHNVLTYAGHLWRRTVEQVGKEFADVATDYLHVDAATISWWPTRDRFDVIVTDEPLRRHHHRPGGRGDREIGPRCQRQREPDRTGTEHVRRVAPTLPEERTRESHEPDLRPHRHPSPASDERRAEIHANPGFGVHFTDHMVRAVWTKDGAGPPGRALRP